MEKNEAKTSLNYYYKIDRQFKIIENNFSFNTLIF